MPTTPRSDEISIPTIAGLVPITEIMSRALLTAHPDAPTAEIVEMLRDKHVGCVPIVDRDGRPIGVITKRDILECSGEARGTARELMMPIALTVGERATVAQVAGLMSTETIHHILVVDEGAALVGVVS